MQIGKVPLLDDDGLNRAFNEAQREMAKAKELLDAVTEERAKREKIKRSKPSFSVNRVDELISQVNKRIKFYQDENRTINSYGGPEPGELKPSQANQLIIQELQKVHRMIEDLRGEAFISED